MMDVIDGQEIIKIGRTPNLMGSTLALFRRYPYIGLRHGELPFDVLVRQKKPLQQG
jgi:hypothetical protein